MRRAVKTGRPPAVPPLAEAVRCPLLDRDVRSPRRGEEGAGDDDVARSDVGLRWPAAVWR